VLQDSDKESDLGESTWTENSEPDDTFFRCSLPQGKRKRGSQGIAGAVTLMQM